MSRPESPLPSPRLNAFASVFAQLTPHMAELDRFLHAQLAAFEPEIRSMVDYCIDTSGKRIRPTLVFLSGWHGTGIVRPELVRAGAVVELVHLATLVHDDIMDEANVRRNRQTASRKFGPAAAVLLGDALFAHALHLATQFPTTEICEAVSESTRRVCAGEIVQTLRRGSTDVSLADYQRIIDLKTAELFRVSCFLGSKLRGSADGLLAAVSEFGRHLGIAYQMYDDLADFFGEESRIGKTLGTDLTSGKLTLPLLLLREHLAANERIMLEEEILGVRPSEPGLRLRQMEDYNVYDEVAARVKCEIGAARVALAEWRDEPATPLLIELCEVITRQLADLRAKRS